MANSLQMILPAPTKPDPLKINITRILICKLIKMNTFFWTLGWDYAPWRHQKQRKTAAAAVDLLVSKIGVAKNLETWGRRACKDHAIILVERFSLFLARTDLESKSCNPAEKCLNFENL